MVERGEEASYCEQHSGGRTVAARPRQRNRLVDWCCAYLVQILWLVFLRREQGIRGRPVPGLCIMVILYG